MATASISIPENRNGSAPPTNAPASISGLVKSSASVSPAGRNAYKKLTISDNAASEAEPMAKPLPIAAVVLPTESSLSVISLTAGSSSAISAIPPALSEIGPYVSTDTVADTKESIPTAAMAIPNIPDTAYETYVVRPSTIRGSIHDFMPTASPCVIVSAGPSLDASAISCVGL